MFNGLDRYKISGNNVAVREIASANPSPGAVAMGKRFPRARETASLGGRETASTNVTTSSMALGAVTSDDITLDYIGGTSNQRAGGGGNKSGVPPEVYKYYDAMYREDSICGPAIELRANIPYGDFVLHGVEKGRLQKFEEAVDNMRLRTVMPRVAIARDVQGSFLGLLDWNSTAKTYDSMIAYSRQHIANITYPIVHGMDPVIDIEPSIFLLDIANSNDPRLDAIKKCLPEYLLNGAKSAGKGIPVPMDSVVWIDRPHTDPRFNSILHRILPIFLIERALTRGTIESAHRRQRGILHITAGSGDLWLATSEEMSDVAALFNGADADPLGAIVVTREGISPNEVRNPTDFWRITDSFEQTVPFKLRALGISESFLSGDACLVGETLVPTTNGLVRIDSLGTGKTRNDMQTINITVDGRFGKGRATGWLYNGFRETLKISTTTGNQLQCTGNHPILVLNKETLETEWKRSDKLVLGDTLCVSPRTTVRKTSLKLNLTLAAVTLRGSNIAKHNPITLPKKMTPQLARLLAYVTAEGWIDAKRGKFGMTNTCPNIINTFESDLQTVFGKTVSVGRYSPDYSQYASCFNSNKAVTNAVVTNRQIVDVLTQLGMTVMSKAECEPGTTPSHYKEIPWSVLQADEECQAAWLAGYLDTDGSNRTKDGRGVGFHSRSQTLLTQTHAILNAHGVFGTSRSACCVMVTSNIALATIATKLEKHLVSKTLENMNDGKYRKTYGIPADAVRQFLKDRMVSWNRHGSVYECDSGKDHIYSASKLLAKDTVRLAYDYIESGEFDELLSLVKTISPVFHARIKTLAKLGYMFTEVQSIASGDKQHVYDISMTTGTEPAFVANGLIVHNTFNNAEVAISTFLQTIKTERNQVTDQLMYRKIFPQIAEANGYRLAGRERGALDIPPEEMRRLRMQALAFIKNGGKETAANAANSLANISLYDTPKLTWKQSLMPEGDAAYIELLNNLAEHNVPAPIRALFAAGGLDFDSVINGANRDIDDRKKLTAYIEKIKENMPQPEPEPGQGGGGGDEFSMFNAFDTPREVGLLNRKYEDAELYEPYTELGSKITRPITARGKRMLRDKQIQTHAEALANIAERHNARIKAKGEFDDG